jgi:type II secretion system protein N
VKKLGYLLLFSFLFLLFGYLNFPFERVLSSFLCERGIYAEKVEFKRLPPELLIEGLRVKELPFEVERLELSFLPSSLFAREKSFTFRARACGGELRGRGTYPLGTLKFTVSGVQLKSCSELKGISGELKGEGELSFVKGSLSSGSGKFYLSNLSLFSVEFGLFRAELLELGKLEGDYRVKEKNLVWLEGKGKGKDANLSFSGSLRFNPESPKSSYLNLKVKVTLKKEPLEGRKFTFRIRGSLNSLRVW